MTAAVWIVLALALATAALWLLLDTVEQHRRRRFHQHTEQALRQANHPSMWRGDDRG